MAKQKSATLARRREEKAAETAQRQKRTAAQSPSEKRQRSTESDTDIQEPGTGEEKTFSRTGFKLTTQESRTGQRHKNLSTLINRGALDQQGTVYTSDAHNERTLEQRFTFKDAKIPTLTVINVYAPVSGLASQREFFKYLGERVNRLQREGEPVIAMGDLNQIQDKLLDADSTNPQFSAPPNEILQDFCHRTGMISAVRAVHTNEKLHSIATPTHSNRHTTFKLIDHIFLSPELAEFLIDAGVDERDYSSDHRAIWAKLDLGLASVAEPDGETARYDPLPLDPDGDWDALERALELALLDAADTLPKVINSNESATAYHNILSDVIIETAKKVIGLRNDTSKNNHKNKLRFDPKLNTLQRIASSHAKIAEQNRNRVDSSENVRKINRLIATAASNITPLPEPASWAAANPERQRQCS